MANEGKEKGIDSGELNVTRRTILGAGAVIAGAGVLGSKLMDPIAKTAHAAGSDNPIRIGFQAHRTGIGTVYGKWYERTTNAAAEYINKIGGIAGRPVEIITEDDGTDPKRGADVVEKLATQHKVDFVYGTLFSHVVMGSAPRAGELKIPYFVVSEGYHVASGKLNRYVFQPCITDVRSQITAVSNWIFGNLGKNVTIIYPDYAFGYDHRDYASAAAEKSGAKIVAKIPIPMTEKSFTRYFAKIPKNTDVIYHIMVGPGVLTFVREMGEFFGSNHPQLFGFIDSLEGVNIGSPGLDFLEGSHVWEAMPRYSGEYDTGGERFYRNAVGVDSSGASKSDSKDVSTFSHMFGCWETLFAIKEAVEKSGYKSKKDYGTLIETFEGINFFNEGIAHPQGPKIFSGKTHQCFGQQFISKVTNGRLKVVHKTTIADGIYEPETDYTKQSL